MSEGLSQPEGGGCCVVLAYRLLPALNTLSPVDMFNSCPWCVSTADMANLHYLMSLLCSLTCASSVSMDVVDGCERPSVMVIARVSYLHRLCACQCILLCVSARTRGIAWSKAYNSYDQNLSQVRTFEKKHKPVLLTQRGFTALCNLLDTRLRGKQLNALDETE